MMGMSLSTSFAVVSSGSPTRISPSLRAAGVKMRMTFVGEPFRPHFWGSAPMSEAFHTVIWAFLEFILPLREGRRGSLISLTTVITQGREARIVSLPSSSMRWAVIVEASMATSLRT